MTIQHDKPKIGSIHQLKEILEMLRNNETATLKAFEVKKDVDEMLEHHQLYEIENVPLNKPMTTTEYNSLLMEFFLLKADILENKIVTFDQLNDDTRNYAVQFQRLLSQSGISNANAEERFPRFYSAKSDYHMCFARLIVQKIKATYNEITALEKKLQHVSSKEYHELTKDIGAPLKLVDYAKLFTQAVNLTEKDRSAFLYADYKKQRGKTTKPKSLKNQTLWDPVRDNIDDIFISYMAIHARKIKDRVNILRSLRFFCALKGHSNNVFSKLSMTELHLEKYFFNPIYDELNTLYNQVLSTKDKNIKEVQLTIEKLDKSYQYMSHAHIDTNRLEYNRKNLADFKTAK